MAKQWVSVKPSGSGLQIYCRFFAVIGPICSAWENRECTKHFFADSFFFFSFPLPRLFSKQLLRMLCKLQVIGWQFFFTAVTDSTHCCWGAAEGTGFANHYEMQKAQGQNPSKFDMKDKWNQNTGLVRPLFCLTKFPPITEQQCLLKGWI